MQLQASVLRYQTSPRSPTPPLTPFANRPQQSSTNPTFMNLNTLIVLKSSGKPERGQRRESTAMEGSCCACTTLLSNIAPLQYDTTCEKPTCLENRSLDCCGRVICGNCIAGNKRYATYCPFCQISITPTPLPQGLKDPPSYAISSTSTTSYTTSEPPSYTRSTTPTQAEDEPPSYTSIHRNTPHTHPDTNEKSTEEPVEDVLHFLDHSTDTLTSLSFRYAVPITALRSTNKITSDHLLLARRTLLIPGKHYKGGVSLSPRPVEGEEEERRRGLVRRWMVACKVAEYDVALLYLKQVDYDLEAAIEAYKEDEQWEKEHPMHAHVEGKEKKRHDVGRRRFTGQT